MTPSPFSTDRRAVSSAIATVLLIGVAVFISTVLAAQFLDLARDAQPKSPDSWIRSSYEDLDGDGDADEVLLTHRLGNPILSDDVEVLVGGETVWRAGTSVDAEIDATGWTDERVNAGSDLTLTQADLGTDRFDPGTTITVVWRDDDGDSRIVATREIPE